MSKIEIDLENLAGIQKEIEILSKRKDTLSAEIEELEKRIISDERDAEKKLAYAKQEVESEIQSKRADLDKRDAELLVKEAEIITRSNNSLIIQDQFNKLQEEKKTFEEEKALFEKSKVSILEKQKQAELLIEQYEKKIAELNYPL